MNSDTREMVFFIYLWQFYHGDMHVKSVDLYFTCYIYYLQCKIIVNCNLMYKRYLANNLGICST